MRAVYDDLTDDLFQDRGLSNDRVGIIAEWTWHV